MTVYFTHDVHDDVTIQENADIMAFDSLAELNEYLSNCYRYGEGLKLTGIQEGSYSDCWIKVYSYWANESYEPFNAEDLIVRKPGSHPGGKETWIEPFPVVYVPVIENVEEDDEE